MCFKGMVSNMYLSRINTTKCSRCNFDVNVRETECPHCKGLSNEEAQDLRKNYRKEAVKANSGLAGVFIKSFVAVVIIMFLIAIA